MVIMGIAMVTGRLTLFAVWMMDAFPVLGTVG
jgi:cytochrome c-type biogenesis protein